ncbi:MAG: phospho-sugar mutase [Myxococcales bacterium]|nr:phospho-sugar mutase [Myxococcales bacterium]
MELDALILRAEEWLRHDPDAEDRRELASLIAARSAELADRFAGPLHFGTAGLRGVLGAGESRMNLAVVRRTSAGLARYLAESVPEARARGVVVGYDGRRKSREFAEATASVLVAAGFRVQLAERLCPTPIVAFAVRELACAAGVMVTASHNPPEYNGYKVYADNGAQIVPPWDAGIAAAILASPAADEVPTAPFAEALASGRIVTFGSELDRRYLAAVLALVPPHGEGRALPIVYTPLHGVGLPLFRAALEIAGFSSIRVVDEQAEPDGDFPTVAFPNPEEPGALDLALTLARTTDAALILANDPDADRLAAVVRARDGRMVQLTGNEVGVLLGHSALEQDLRLANSVPALVVTTIVSSPQLLAIAAALGAESATTLTGFKWIANHALAREASGNARFVFGYEEALGYCLGTVVRDKDGISAALALATLAADLHARGQTLLDELERIARRYGLYLSHQRSLQFPGALGAERMARLMGRLRDAPPTRLGRFEVTTLVDCARSTRRERGDCERSIAYPKSDVLIFELAEGHRVISRPSGTEPKLKIYYDVREPLAAEESLADATTRAHSTISELDLAMVALIGEP